MANSFFILLHDTGMCYTDVTRRGECSPVIVTLIHFPCKIIDVVVNFCGRKSSTKLDFLRFNIRVTGTYVAYPPLLPGLFPSSVSRVRLGLRSRLDPSHLCG